MDLEPAQIECDLQLLGCTGLEDLLQDDVAKCIYDFRSAGISVWMLTGDKKETAINIAISCGLISKQDTNVKVVISGETDLELQKQFELINLEDDTTFYTTLISGPSLQLVFKEKSYSEKLKVLFK